MVLAVFRRNVSLSCTVSRSRITAGRTESTSCVVCCISASASAFKMRPCQSVKPPPTCSQVSECCRHFTYEYLLTYLVPRRCSSTQRQLLHESSPCSSILSGTSSILYGKIQQSTVFFKPSIHLRFGLPLLRCP